MFGTKLDLFLEVFKRAVGRIRDAFAAVLADGPFDPTSEDDQDRMGLAYTELLPDHDFLQVMMHGFSAGGIREIAAAARQCMGEIFATIQRTGWTDEEVRDFIAHGMLLNVMISMRAPEHLEPGHPLARAHGLRVRRRAPPCLNRPRDHPRPRLRLPRPARHAAQRGLDPVVIVSGVDESQLDGLPPAELALQLAELKCAAVAGRDDVPAGALVLGCDSVLDLDGVALGKPGRRRRGAFARWQQMRGRSGVLHTGHSLRDTATGQVAAATASTTVHFADVTDDEIAAYVATGEPLVVAGAFTVDGLGGAFVTGIEGDHHNVVGVSLPLVRELLPSWVTGGRICGLLVEVHRRVQRLDASSLARRPERVLLELRQPTGFGTPGCGRGRTGRPAEEQADHVRRDVVGVRVVEPEHVPAEPQAPRSGSAS